MKSGMNRNDNDQNFISYDSYLSHHIIHRFLTENYKIKIKPSPLEANKTGFKI